jgi:superfamily II DNA or RNA helicase
MQLRKYQERFVRNIAESLAKNKRVIAQLATGGGKTVTFSAISKRFNEKSGQRVLILVHRIELLDQAARTIKRNTGLESVKIVAGMKSIPDAQVYVAMVETTYRRLDKLPEFGLIIIDEAHIGNFTKLIEHYSNKYIIGFTATPIASKKDKPLKNYFNDIVCGVSIQELIADGHLCTADHFAIKGRIKRSDLKMFHGDFDSKQMGQLMGTPKYIKSVIDNYKQKIGNAKTLVFNCNIEHSMLVTAEFKLAGYQCRHLDGETEYNLRNEILHWFDITPNAILCNVGVATTGFDQPDVECIIVNRATASMPLWLQMCGRGSRPTSTKNKFTILDLGGNVDVFSYWQAERDWIDIFHNPEKKTDGVAPVKICPNCSAAIPTRLMICSYCNYEYPIPEIVESYFTELEKIQTPEMISKVVTQCKEKGNKEFRSLFILLELAIKQFRKVKDKDQLPRIAESIARKWAIEIGHKDARKALFVARKFINNPINLNHTWKKSSSLSTQM